MESKEVKQRKGHRIFIIITYSFTSLVAAFFIIAFVPKLIDEYMGIIMGDVKGNFSGWEGIVMELTFYIFVIGFFLSIKRSAIGGIVILLASVVQMGPFLIIDGNMGSLIFGIPMLICGILLLLVHRYSILK